MRIRQSTEYQRELRMLYTAEAKQMWRGEGSWEEHVAAQVASGYCPGCSCNGAGVETSPDSPLCVVYWEHYEAHVPLSPRGNEVHVQRTMALMKTLFTRPWQLRRTQVVSCDRCAWQRTAASWIAGRTKAAHIRGTCGEPLFRWSYPPEVSQYDPQIGW